MQSALAQGNAHTAAAMGGQRGSGGVVSGDTDLGDLRGHSQGSMSSACETPGRGVSELGVLGA